MINSIGETAGQIWHYLSQKGESSLTKIKQELEVNDAQVSYALGWLAREGKILISKKGNTTKVGLVE